MVTKTLSKALNRKRFVLAKAKIASFLSSTKQVLLKYSVSYLFTRCLGGKLSLESAEKSFRTFLVDTSGRATSRKITRRIFSMLSTESESSQILTVYQFPLSLFALKYLSLNRAFYLRWNGNPTLIAWESRSANHETRERRNSTGKPASSWKRTIEFRSITLLHDILATL